MDSITITEELVVVPGLLFLALDQVFPLYGKVLSPPVGGILPHGCVTKLILP